MKQDKSIQDLMLVIEVHGQDLHDKMKLKKSFDGRDVRLALAMLGDHTMELAKTLSDLNEKIEFLKECDQTQADALIMLLKKSKTPYHRRAYNQFRSIFRYFFWRIPM